MTKEWHFSTVKKMASHEIYSHRILSGKGWGSCAFFILIKKKKLKIIAADGLLGSA